MDAQREWANLGEDESGGSDERRQEPDAAEAEANSGASSRGCERAASEWIVEKLY